mmetsp:Transcript_37709/g.72280  ORF Transcript_37709/g.72280 Transcript_37709/m.72280 type:complete len:268 (-) Transcript_37709:878-1681(-)
MVCQRSCRNTHIDVSIIHDFRYESILSNAHGLSCVFAVLRGHATAPVASSHRLPLPGLVAFSNCWTSSTIPIRPYARTGARHSTFRQFVQHQGGGHECVAVLGISVAVTSRTLFDEPTACSARWSFSTHARSHDNAVPARRPSGGAHVLLRSVFRPHHALPLAPACSLCTAGSAPTRDIGRCGRGVPEALGKAGPLRAQSGDPDEGGSVAVDGGGVTLARVCAHVISRGDSARVHSDQQQQQQQQRSELCRRKRACIHIWPPFWCCG